MAGTNGVGRPLLHEMLMAMNTEHKCSVISLPQSSRSPLKVRGAAVAIPSGGGLGVTFVLAFHRGWGLGKRNSALVPILCLTQF